MDKGTIVRIVGAALGVLLGALMLTIGFWQALLLGALAGAGWHLGGSAAPKAWTSALIDRLRAARGAGADR